MESERDNPAVYAEDVVIRRLEDLDEPIDPRITSSTHDVEKHHPTGSIETKGTFPSAESRTVAMASLAEEKEDLYVRDF
jgi:hypothetical protein